MSFLPLDESLVPLSSEDEERDGQTSQGDIWLTSSQPSSHPLQGTSPQADPMFSAPFQLLLDKFEAMRSQISDLQVAVTQQEDHPARLKVADSRLLLPPLRNVRDYST